MANKNNKMGAEAIDFPLENGVHIAGGHGSEVKGISNDFNATNPSSHSGQGVKCAKRGCSSGVERSVHIGKVRSSKLRTPTTRHFSDISDSGFADYFWSRVAVGAPAHCWPWMLSSNGDGYGQIKVGGSYWTASRLAYVLTTGVAPKTLFVCHHCDNPICCNPAHLYAGTRSANERDKVKRGRNNPARGERNHFSRLTATQVENIRRLFGQGMTNVSIGKLMGVHHSTISKIRTGNSW